MTSKQTAANLLRQCIDKATFPTSMDKHSALQWLDELASCEQPKRLHQIAEPATAGTAVRAFRDYLGVHDGIKLGGQAMDDMALDLARIALDFKHLVEPRHPDDAAVDALAVLMKAKLAKQRGKGYRGWDTDCTQQRLSDLLRGHVDKGDPVDVANFCAFLLARGEGIAAAPQAVQACNPLTAAQITAAWEHMKPGIDKYTSFARAIERAHGIQEQSDNQHAKPAECEVLYTAPAHPAEGVPAMAAPFAEVLTDEDMEDFVSTHGFTGDFESMARIVEEKVLEKVAATQPAAQGLDAPNEWEGIHTMPTCDDLIWLYCKDTNTIDGPIAPDPSLEQYGWTHWAYANAPSTAGIDAAQAKQGGAA